MSASDCWTQAHSGIDIDLLNPDPSKIRLDDIARCLSRIPRFLGATIGDYPWNVAQHSILVESLMPSHSSPEDRLAALLHDAHEAYVGDLPSPVKWAMDEIYSAQNKDPYVGTPPSFFFREITQRLDRAIYKTFGIAPDIRVLSIVNKADLTALAVERALLMAPCEREWGNLPPLPDPVPQLRPCHPPARAEEVFLDRFNVLQRLRHGL